MEKKYSEDFYKARHHNTSYSAETICAIVKELVEPKSIVDIGCGVGTWLKTFEHAGVENLMGIEGKWVDKDVVVIDQKDFVQTDLEEEFSSDRSFDLAISLEVAEHISPASADKFVKSIVGLAPVVLFSAAIPLQGGKHHVNEQWPDYWQEKFAAHGYHIIDCIRPRIWADPKIEMWYAQNSFIYVKKEVLDQYPKLKALYVENPMMISAVLPRFYHFKLTRWPVMKALKNRIKRALS